MTPSRPFFLRAIFDWLNENECTPYISVFAGFPTTQVPLEFVEDEHITLNISPSAVADFHFDNDSISFKARFSGASKQVYIPMGAVTGMFAKENGHGMGFPDEAYYTEQAERLSVQENIKAPVASGLKSVSDATIKTIKLDKSAEGESAKVEEEGVDKVPVKPDAKSDKKVSHLKVIK